MQPINDEQKASLVQMVKDKTQHYNDGMITFGEWQQFLVLGLTKPEVYAAWDAEQQVEQATGEIRTTVIVRHKDIGSNEVHEMLCKAIHEGDPEALSILHGAVTSIDSPEFLSD